MLYVCDLKCLFGGCNASLFGCFLSSLSLVLYNFAATLQSVLHFFSIRREKEKSKGEDDGRRK